MVKIFSDSTCDLSKELKEKYNIGIIPLYIILSDKEYRDGVDISPDDIYSWSEENKLSPKTAAASAMDVEEAIRPALDNGDDVIIFSISGEMSTTVNVFRMAAEEYGGRVFVVDSRNLSTGVGHLVIKAAEMASEGYPADEIVSYVEELIPKVRSSFVVDTLDYLYRGGRCSGISALAGGILRLHPKIIVSGGKMSPSKKYRGNMKKVVMDYVKDQERDLMNADTSRIFITHSGCDESMIDPVFSYLNSLGRFEEILITRAGGVISSHCGPGTLGILYILQD